MSRLSTLAGAVLLALATQAPAQELLIRDATVHTATARGTLQHADILVRGGRIAAVGTSLAAPAGVQTVDAHGAPVTPALFGGLTHLGIEEVSGEESTVDADLGLGRKTHEMVVRPEFDVTLAFSPDASAVPVTRIEGVGETMLMPGLAEGGSIILGQGGMVRMDGSPDPVGPRVLFVALGSQSAEQTGQSRAAQWMLLEQWLDEARGHIPANTSVASLTPAGRATLARFAHGGGLVMFEVDRAADIHQLLKFAARQHLRVGVVGGAEAWRVAHELAAAKVPVFVDPLADLPASFDQIGARMDNAAILRQAGVTVGIVQGGENPTHNARNTRQLAGNAVANGLPWEDGLAALTRVPAEVFGVRDTGSIAVGQRADLVLWTGDPLDVANVAKQVWFDGRAISMRSRQTELRDRYMAPKGAMPRAYDVPDHRR
ncbi:amidohydrolase family protein [Cognatilysobacter lacus]|uniref:Amidohydrolase family protein n=1 Tax=Cognatilysobacter lacus TaxID=1643323 RepID=A0A5D8Z660_9GAMM|nr:amidohydrolase family protein [Lysobacter lacus]TZF90251.1 amidohydrolase family protein [Lysobacter lacus]